MLRPLENRVILDISKYKKEETTSSGIILTGESSKEAPVYGVVVAVGPGRTLDNGEVVKIEVKEGDKVVYHSFTGTEVEYEGKEYIIVPAQDILAVVE
ncbi:co-chaperone GroES [Nosocomiicoccus massiliensis]|uniref:co-chaperone GroES n=1 Tax=Nosocomiicoccus massiliensis TaxID=1232430 RepID=UPI00041D7A2C|nr:co-chaperone GroES [Nosocomiicoccus massiliensis]